MLIGVGSPAADPTNNIAYFATSEAGGPARIRKVSGDCSGEIDSNYGNFSTTFGARTHSMVVDPVNGDLYFADDGEIVRITTTESVTVVKTGLPTNMSIASLSREGVADPGTLLLVVGGNVQAIALDNLNADPIPVVAVAGSTTAGFGAQVSGGPWLDANINRTVTVYRESTDLILSDHPLMDVTLEGPFQVRISSPSTTEQLPLGQSRMRPSTFGDTSFSHAVTKLQYQDGLSRLTCAWVGDPGPGAPQYDPSPSVPSDCHTPRTSASLICDNHHDIVTGGPGSFVEAGDPLESCKTCGGMLDPCVWEFRITNRFGGDNYKVYFAFDQSSAQFAATSDIYTAWKHVHIERERMCNVGSVLFDDYGATGQCGGAGQPACCGTGGQPPCNQILLYDASNISMGDSLVVFDEVNPYETAGYTRTVTAAPVNNGNGSVTVTLDSPLPRSYWASRPDPVASPPVPDFRNGHSGGACVPSGGFVEADLSELREGFDHALVDYHVPVYGLDESGVVPRLWPAFFDLNPSTGRPCATWRFSQVWNSQFVDSGSVGCAAPDASANSASANNVFHLIPAFDTLSAVAGLSVAGGAFSYILDDQIAQDCAASTVCTATEQDAMRRWTCAHETAHQFLVNACSPGSGFHDTRKAWCGAPGGACAVPPATDQDCVMVTSSPPSVPELDMRADGTDHFCKEDLALGDPNCSGAPREGAIRTREDPQ